MRKILTIARREYRAMVATKAFIFSMAMMPLLMFGSILAMQLLEDTAQVKEKKVAVLDNTPEKVIFLALEAAATVNNQMIDKASEQESEADLDDDGPPSLSKGTKYVFESLDSLDDDKRLELSELVRQQDLAAFVEIPADITEIGSTSSIEFFSEDSGLSEARRWVGRVVNETVRVIRLQAQGLDPVAVQQASTPVNVKGLGLVSRSATGEISTGEEKNELAAIFLPMIIMMMMFMVIFMASQPMLESVLEEKSQRIAEVLLGSANPSQLMAGKLLGTVGGSLTIFGVYLIGAYAVAAKQGYADHIPFAVAPWFVVFQIFGVMFYAAIFMAVGSSVSQLKEAQSMLLPVWMLLMSPMFIWFYVVQEPNGPLATWFSLFPPATPTMMLLRMATGVTIPLWQPLVGIVLLAIATVICVYIAGRIFRVGILWQGKTPKLSEIMRWAFTG